MKYVAYLRVSTARQGITGLGIDAQRSAVLQLARNAGAELVAEYTEVESGSRDDRPQLKAALAQCRRQKATLVIARLDRLTRNARFLLELRDSTIEFVAADAPHMDKFSVGVMALVAERERDLISIRTKEALAAARRRGVRLGNPRLAETASGLGNAAIAIRVDAFDANVTPIVRSIQSAGVTTLLGLASALNARGVKTRRGGQWYAASVARLLARG